jgi:hypothetical protein
MPAPMTPTAITAGRIGIPAAAPAPAAVPEAGALVPSAFGASAASFFGSSAGAAGCVCAIAPAADSWTIAANAAIEAKRVFLSMSLEFLE